MVPAPVLSHDKRRDFTVRIFASYIGTLCQAEGYCNATT